MVHQRSYYFFARLAADYFGRKNFQPHASFLQSAVYHENHHDAGDVWHRQFGDFKRGSSAAQTGLVQAPALFSLFFPVDSDAFYLDNFRRFSGD